MNDYLPPELKEAFKALLEWFPDYGYRITPKQLLALTAVPQEAMVRLGWIIQNDPHELERAYLPAGELLETIKTTTKKGIS